MNTIIPCPHCGNRTGFVCGTCCYCHWDQIEQRFTTIQVRVDHVNYPSFILVRMHAERTRNTFRRPGDEK